MRRILIPAAATFLVVAWFSYAYVTQDKAQAQATPTTRPLATTEPSHPNPFKELRGQPGFWRLGQDQSGVWWFVSPEGKLEFLNTVTTVQPQQDGRDKDAAAYLSTDWDGKDKPRDLDLWATATLRRVQDYGFKGLGAWCHPAFHSLSVPCSQDLNLWAWVTDSSKRFYTPDWEVLTRQAVKSQVPPLADNHNLVGYYLDNELDWGDGFSGPGAYFDNLSNTDPNRQQVIQTIHFVWPLLHDFNMAWDSKLTSWSQLEAWQVLPRDQADAYNRLSNAWLSHLAQDYFRVTTDLVHRYDHNHLILGVRFKGFAPEPVVAASRDYTDAQSLNYYVSDARLDQEMFQMMYQRSGQPIIISEYSFHAMDGRSGDIDSVGFSAQVPDQQARADGYKLMTTRLARVPYIVGADWFQWCDEPPQGRSGDGEDVNFGIVDIHDKPYELLVNSIRETTLRLNNLHTASATDSGSDIWRDSYAKKPTVHIPFMSKPPVFDGDLSHFTGGVPLDGVQCDQTVGLDRANVRKPDLFLGWNHDGLYIAMQVFDSKIESAPATAWWWTRDNAELFVSTRPVATDQISYDIYCHQFFVVPQDPSASNAAIVGQWHRDGDALKDNLIPHPSIEKIVKILPDRYIVEMFIPAAALHGFDPARQPQLAFNFHVRDFNKAADFFWSAPKSSRTELRPNTWGNMILDPAPPIAPSPTAAQARAD
jgi:hypothetical protein